MLEHEHGMAGVFDAPIAIERIGEPIVSRCMGMIHNCAVRISNLGPIAMDAQDQVRFIKGERKEWIEPTNTHHRLPTDTEVASLYIGKIVSGFFVRCI